MVVNYWHPGIGSIWNPDTISGSQEKIAVRLSVATNRNSQAMASTMPTFIGALPTEKELSIRGFVISLLFPSDNFFATSIFATLDGKEKSWWGV